MAACMVKKMDIGFVISVSVYKIRVGTDVRRKRKPES